MKIVLTIAWRNVWRRKRRTLLTAGTVALGLALLLVSIGLGDGGHYQMIESAVRLGSGHVVIQQQGYQQTRGIAKLLDGADQAAAGQWLERMSGPFTVESVVRRVFASGLAASAEDAAGVLIVGLQPEQEKKASKFFEKLAAGVFPESDDSERAVLGKGLARRLDLKIGDKLVLTAQEVRGTELQSILLRVSGLLDTGIQDVDEAMVLMPIATAQRFLKLGEEVHQIAVLLQDSRPAAKLARLGRQQLPQLEVLDWAQAIPELSDFILVDDAGNYLFNMVFFVLIAFLVLNTLQMSVLERRREFTLLDALGLTPAKRFAMVMAEAGVVAALSAAFGVLLGLLGHLYFAVRGLQLTAFYSGELTAAGVAFDPVIYSFLSLNRIFGCILLVFLMTLLLALFPARRAARAADAYLLGRV